MRGRERDGRERLNNLAMIQACCFALVVESGVAGRCLTLPPDGGGASATGARGRIPLHQARLYPSRGVPDKNLGRAQPGSWFLSDFPNDSFLSKMYISEYIHT